MFKIGELVTHIKSGRNFTVIECNHPFYGIEETKTASYTYVHIRDLTASQSVTSIAPKYNFKIGDKVSVDSYTEEYEITKIDGFGCDLIELVTGNSAYAFVHNLTLIQPKQLKLIDFSRNISYDPLQGYKKVSHCDHLVSEYIGFREAYSYCVKCNKKF